MTTHTPTILFVCAHNAGRSALGAALARTRGGDTINAQSAGVTPAETASATTIATLAELGIDDSAHQPSALTDEQVRAADIVIAMKSGLNIPHHDHVRYETWDLADPATKGINGVRELRDDIDRRVTALLAELAAD